MSARKLILILGDQLSMTISSLQAADREHDHVLLAEVMAEATYVRHHKKKIAFVFSAMRHFADALRANGWSVDHVRLDDPQNSGSLEGEVNRHVKVHGSDEIIVTEAGEWRLMNEMKAWPSRLGVPCRILEDTRFITTHDAFEDWARGRKTLRMEHFYRAVRRKTGLLMDGGRPEGGRWNYDFDNRKPASAGLFAPTVSAFSPDGITRDVLDLVERRFPGHFGDLTPFWFATTREQAEQALDNFLATALPYFGDYQDAMLRDEQFLYHSVLSHYINTGLLDPLDVCRRVEAEYVAGRCPINAAEGFIRQVIGWREYMRGIYWLKMPGYAEVNHFGANRPLPPFYWTGETDLACLSAAITQTREQAYAHHIQRLMVTGNFAMLAGVDPKAVHEWYLAVYADAYEWVELPNTIGMSQFADGGLLGSKPYAAGGNYINRMSDYCRSCRYDVKRKTGDGACPLNALYWHFLDRNAGKLRGNSRLFHSYRTWDRMDDQHRKDVRDSASRFLASLD